MARVETVTPHVARQWLEAGEAVLVDVRPESYRAARHIPGAIWMPLQTLDLDRLPREGRRVVFQCEVGVTSQAAAERAVGRGMTEVYNLQGGIRAWARAGLPVEAGERQPISLQRQVQMIAGSLVIAGTLGALAEPWLLLVPGLVGAGLVLAGATGWCGMSAVLLRLPYNRRSAAG